MTPVYLEVGGRRVFACSLDWPGWCRSGRTEDDALAALADHAPRFAVVAGDAGVRFPKTAGDRIEVVERLKGDATTDFGAPGAIAAADREKVTRARAARHVAVLEASWRALAAAAAASPPSLRKGPRGGGRDRDAIVAHVAESEDGYSRKIGVKLKGASVDERRAAILEVLGRPSDGSPHAPKGWPPRYAARRLAWHALDHAWEIEDRRT